MTAKEQARDKRLRKKYNISLAEYNEMLEKQGGVCAVCGRPAGTISLSVDHCHKYRYFRIACVKVGKDGWEARVTVKGCAHSWFAGTRSEAIGALREILKRLSVRGILCSSCNTGLRKYRDNPDYLEAAAAYLRRFLCSSS